MVDIGPSPNEPSGEYITILVAWKGGDRLIMLSPDGARGGRIWAEMQKCRTMNSCLNDKELAALISSKKADGVGDVTFNQINANADTTWGGHGPPTDGACSVGASSRRLVGVVGLVGACRSSQLGELSPNL